MLCPDVMLTLSLVANDLGWVIKSIAGLYLPHVEAGLLAVPLIQIVAIIF